MNDETKDLLQEYEKELMAEALQEEQEAGPAFEDPDVLDVGVEPDIYSNFANDYGRELQEFAESGGEEQEDRKESILTVLMLIATILSLGIITVMLYWLQSWM